MGRNLRHTLLSLGLGAAALSGCSLDSFLNNTASFGGDTAGDRGSVDVIIINNTAARAVFTIGTYDDLDQFSVPDSRQFTGDPDGVRLEAGDDTAILSFDCARVLSVGGPDLLRLIEDNDPDFETDSDSGAFVPGIFFSNSDVESPNSALPTAGIAPDFNVFLGVDFACESYVVLRLEVDDVGPAQFRVDLEVFPPE